MARPFRLEWPGALYHVRSRGDRREPIVEDDEDRAAWVAGLAEACGRFGWRVHAGCLMTNHYHLLRRKLAHIGCYTVCTNAKDAIEGRFGNRPPAACIPARDAIGGMWSIWR